MRYSYQSSLEDKTMATMTPEMMKRIIESERWIQESEASRELGMPNKPAKVVDVRDLMKGVKK